MKQEQIPKKQTPVEKRKPGRPKTTAQDRGGRTDSERDGLNVGRSAQTCERLPCRGLISHQGMRGRS